MKKTSKSPPNKIHNQLSLLVENIHFCADVKKIRKKLKIPAEGFSSVEAVQKWSKKDSEFDSEVVTLIKRFNLSKAYIETISKYILWNSINYDHNIKTVLRFNKTLKKNELFIQVFEHTSIDDIRWLWPQVLYLKQSICSSKGSKKIKTKPTLQKAKTAKLLKQQGYSQKDIWGIFIEFGVIDLNKEYSYIGMLLKRLRDASNEL